MCDAEVAHLLKLFHDVDKAQMANSTSAMTLQIQSDFNQWILFWVFL